MATVVQVEDVNVENIDFIMLKKTFNTNLLLLKWKNETKVYVILNLLEVSAYSIEEIFYEASRDYFVKHRTQFDVFLSLDTHTFVCHQDKLYKMVKLLHERISESPYETAFMRFNRDSLSFKTEKRNKNNDAKCQLFAAKLCNEMQRCTEKYINKTFSIYKLDDSPTPVCLKSCKKKKNLPPRKSADSRPDGYDYVENLDSQPFDHPAFPCIRRKREDMPNIALPLRPIADLPSVPEHHHVDGSTEIPSTRPPNVNENNVRSDIQFRSHVDELHPNDSTNLHARNNPVPTVLEELAFDVSQNDSRSEICIDGSSYNRTGQFHVSLANFYTDFRLPPPAVVQQNRTFPMGHIGGSTSSQQQQYQQQNRETTFSELARPQAIPQQRNGNDLVRDLGRVRSPEYADLTVRLGTFTRWPSHIAQTSAKVAEAGFYYTGFQDTVRCFVCDGGLKNWDPDDDPWIEHARWFPQCAYVRHIKGEEFINLVRMSTEESDEEDDNTVHTGATWGGAKNSNTSADSASHEIAEPSVLESKDAQYVIEMGFSKKVVAMAINDIFKKGKEDFTSQEITDIILEKDMLGEPSNSMLAVDCPPTIENVSPTEHATFENKRLKELLQCTECKSRQRNILFLPCTHHVVCELCSRDLHICTYCYRKIKDKVRTYMS